MKIKVYPPPFIKADAINEDGYIFLSDGKTLKDLYKELKIPLFLKEIVFCSVNYKKTKISIELKDGDIVSFITFMAGG